jgi:23S rRNA pseudouridine955/2504/2580 synthase
MSASEKNAVRHMEVSKDDDDIRVDRWFKRHFPDVPYGQLAKWLRTGQVRVDGGRVKPSVRLSSGQEIRLPPMASGASGALGAKLKVSAKDAADLQSRVFYKDDHVIAINKPSGLAVQGGTRTTRHVDGMLDALRYGAEERPRLVHRLDKDTSGVLLLARTRQAAQTLSRAFQGRSVDKVYWALVMGVPEIEAGTIDSPLAKGGDYGHEKMEGAEDGQFAETDYRIIDHAAGRVAWLELRPRTGRTHQLRAHCALIGNPILGDGKYGGRASFFSGLPKRLHLHAHTLSLPHPAGGERLQLSAPLDIELRESWKFLGFDPKNG